MIPGSDDRVVWIGEDSFGGMPSFFDIHRASGGGLGRVDLPDRLAPIDVNGPWLPGWEFDRRDAAAPSLYPMGLPAGCVTPTASLRSRNRVPSGIPACRTHIIRR